MKCVICKHGETKTGTTSITLEQGETIVIIKSVPAQVCENCAEYYLSEEITQQVLTLAQEAVKHHAEVEIIRFAA